LARATSAWLAQPFAESRQHPARRERSGGVGGGREPVRRWIIAASDAASASAAAVWRSRRGCRAQAVHR
jgi:hypothetical protein